MNPFPNKVAGEGCFNLTDKVLFTNTLGKASTSLIVSYRLEEIFDLKSGDPRSISGLKTEARTVILGTLPFFFFEKA